MATLRQIMLFLLMPVLYVTLPACAQQEAENEDAMEKTEGASILLADPAIFYHEGIYYLYGTSGTDANQGFEVYTSRDKLSWEGPAGNANGYALSKGDAFGDRGFWAPQVFQYDGRFYMAYTANENIAIAAASHPLGPFRQQEAIALEAAVKQIDPFVFFDDDGKIYLYHVRLTEGNRLFVAEMEADLSAIKEETLKECIAAEDDWENTQEVDWPVVEGPSVFKEDGVYYFLYSANDFRNPDYAVGFATSNSPLGPWKRYEGNPILSQPDINHPGPGHGDLFLDESGKMQYVFHTHNNVGAVAPRKTAIIPLSIKEKALRMDHHNFEFLMQP